MAKATPKKPARKASRAPKTISLAGKEYRLLRDGGLELTPHRLNAQQVAILKEKVAERLAIAQRPGSSWHDRPGDYARDYGMRDLLWAYQFSANAKDEILHLSVQLTETSNVIGSLREFMFFKEGRGRQQGAELLRQLADAADRHVQRIRHLAESIRLESSTTLADWTKRWTEYNAL